MPPWTAAVGVPLFASSRAGTSVLLIVRWSLPSPSRRLITSMVDSPASVMMFPSGSRVIRP
jgi:hypothetical protein